MDEVLDLVCITKPWMGQEEDVKSEEDQTHALAHYQGAVKKFFTASIASARSRLAELSLAQRGLVKSGNPRNWRGRVGGEMPSAGQALC